MATAGKILMYPVGNWTSGNNYGFLDIVYYGGSSYIAKTDIINSTINPVTDTTNWQILAHGYIADTLSGIDGIDTSGLLGTAGATVASQTLIDKIADMVADKLVLKTAISNQQINDTNKVTGSALTYSMNQSIIDLNSNLIDAQNGLSNISAFFPNTQTFLMAYGLAQTRLSKNASDSADYGTELYDKNYITGVVTVLRMTNGLLRLIKIMPNGTETYQDIAQL